MELGKVNIPKEVYLDFLGETTQIHWDNAMSTFQLMSASTHSVAHSMDLQPGLRLVAARKTFATLATTSRFCALFSSPLMHGCVTVHHPRRVSIHASIPVRLSRGIK